MAERRKVKRRRDKADTRFPAIDHRGGLIISERRHLPARRVSAIIVDDVDLPTMFLGINKQM